MKERGILFQADMVNAIRDKRKTQTRRVMKRQPPGSTRKCRVDDVGEWAFINDFGWESDWGLKCPYGVVGEHLWVKETWRMSGSPDWTWVVYQADWERKRIETNAGWQMIEKYSTHWQPSIFMPRKLSRIDLEITDVRAERVQDITEEDAKAEGFGLMNLIDPQAWFRGVWYDLHAKPKPSKRNPYTLAPEKCYVSYPWEDIRETREKAGLPWYVVGNPWTFALTFKDITDGAK